jgi:hypothetical protein
VKNTEKIINNLLQTDGFSSWLRNTRRALRTDSGAEVLCGECKACCTSSYFIHIKPEEIQTLERIPEELMFAAPGLPEGNMLLGFDEKGHCPMFINNKCSIYDYRPQTCRQYDCRIFTATGLHVDGDRVLISRQAGLWKFNFPEQQDQKDFSAVQSAAKFIQDHAECFPPGFIPGNSPQQAVLAIKVYKVFLNLNGETKKEIADRIIATYRSFSK